MCVCLFVCLFFDFYVLVFNTLFHTILKITIVLVFTLYLLIKFREGKNVKLKIAQFRENFYKR